MRGSWAPAFLWGLASPAWNIRHSRRNAVWRALRATLGTQITVEFGGPSADHGAPAFLWGLANRARITRHSRSYAVWRAMRALGAQIAVWVGLPRVEPKAKLCAGNGAIAPVWCALPPARPSGARNFWEVWQKRWIERLRAQVYNICSTFARYNVSTSARCTDSFIC